MSVFTLEAFDAEHGECLLLHWGERLVPRFLLVDGGPGWDTFTHRLRPRLAELKGRYTGQMPLPLPLVVASHVDDDHIGGLLALMRDLDGSRYDVAEVGCLWHNSFASLAGDSAAGDQLKSIVSAAPEIERRPDEETRRFASENWAIDKGLYFATASIDHGRALDRLASNLDIKRNCGFPDGLVVAPAHGVARHTLQGLGLTVIWPDEVRLERLRREWRKGLVTAAVDDTSITNLASIVILAEHEGRRMLLTGDARGDHIIRGLEHAGLMQEGGVIDVDILKVQHHGSDHSSDREFFDRVRARHYVVSANGRYGNPAESTLQALVDANAQRRYQVHLTNCGDPGTELRQMIDRFRSRHTGIFRCRDAANGSIRIELAESIDH